MSGQKILEIIVIMLPYLIFIIEWFRNQKTITELLEDCNRYAYGYAKKIDKEIALKEIIINSKKTKENYYETLEKIEKELFQ